MLQIPYRVAYRMRFRGVFIFLLFTAGAVFMGYTAAANRMGLIIDGIFRLSTVGATTFYWILAALLGLLAVWSLFGVVRGALFPAYFELTQVELLLPKAGFSRERVTIPYQAITGLQEQAYRGRKIGLLVQAFGRRFVISAVMLPSGDYEKVKLFLASRMKGGYVFPAASPGRK